MMGFFKTIANRLRPSSVKAPAKLPGRNENCWCGSGKKYKTCHLSLDEERAAEKKCSQSCGHA
jgi:hypothetical protein